MRTQEESSHLCGGACCKAFPLSITLKELQDSLLPDAKTKFTDGEQVAGMLIPLGEMTRNEVSEKYGVTSVRSSGGEEKCEWFTCKNLSEDRKCMIYETRPHLCRIYPRSYCSWRECKATCSVFDYVKKLQESC